MLDTLLARQNVADLATVVCLAELFRDQLNACISACATLSTSTTIAAFPAHGELGWSRSWI